MTVDRRVQEEFPLISPADAGLAVTEVAHMGLARMLSPGACDLLVTRLAKAATAIRPRKRQALEALYRDMTGDHANMPDPETYVRDLLSTLLQQRMFYARLAADADWRPKFEIVGAEALVDVQRRGQGAVLWLLPQEMIGLLARMAIEKLGLALPFVSHVSHGQSTSRIGRKLFNARDCRVEARFGQRLVMTDDGVMSALRSARKIVEAGGLVGFRGIGWAARPNFYPLFSGHMQLALGAPATASRSGAALFVVGACRTDAGFCVTFKRLGNSEERALEDIGADFADDLQRAAQADPSLWSAQSRQWAPGEPPVPFSPVSHHA